MDQFQLAFYLAYGILVLTLENEGRHCIRLPGAAVLHLSPPSWLRGWWKTQSCSICCIQSQMYFFLSIYTQYGESGTPSNFWYQYPTYTQTGKPTDGHTTYHKILISYLSHSHHTECIPMDKLSLLFIEQFPFCNVLANHGYVQCCKPDTSWQEQRATERDIRLIGKNGSHSNTIRERGLGGYRQLGRDVNVKGLARLRDTTLGFNNMKQL